MRKSKNRPHRKIRESDIRRAELFCSTTAVLAVALCIFFLSGLLRRYWVLNFILITGILMNLSLVLTSVLRKRTAAAALGGLMLLTEAAALIYFAIIL